MSEATKVVGLVCAAGVGSRMGLGSPKQYMKFGSEAMLVHTVRALRAVERMGEIVVVVSPTDPYIDDVARHFPENVRVLRCGGRERAESVVNGLLNAGFDRDAWVLVHDAARPCLKPRPPASSTRCSPTAVSRAAFSPYPSPTRSSVRTRAA